MCVRGGEKQDDRTEGDRAWLWKTDTCPSQKDNQGTAVQSPSSETSRTGVCALGEHSTSLAQFPRAKWA